ncbi:MAG: alpha/beta hydrolase [Pararhodobacter sp.]|nr:alpha/beta hydrolase [Pararhodobacter sp.]
MTGISGFAQQRVATGAVALSCHRAGRGEPLILLHGFPQNHLCWEAVAPALAKHFDVIIPDLRGYGDSDAPPDDAEHTVYSKRTMASDIVGLMDALKLKRAHVLGHDRGARVAYRLALDHPARVDRLGIIEVLPTLEYWEAFDAELAMSIYHWTLLAQPAPLPERLIGHDPAFFVDHCLRNWTQGKTLEVFAPAALSAYRRQAADPLRLAAMCADYRAGATTDRALDAADRAAGRMIDAPLHFLWAESGFPARAARSATTDGTAPDPGAIWRRWARQVTASSCVSGHFVMEENPEAVLRAYLPHFGAG